MYTDHSSLIWLNKLPNPSRRQSRWVDILQGHEFEVVYIKGASNPADAFTRVPWQDDVVDEGEEPIKEPLLVLRTMGHAIREAGIQVKVSNSKLQEWQQSTQKFLEAEWKLPLIYKTISEAYALDDSFSDVNWINLNHITHRNGLYYKWDKVVIPDVDGVKIDVLVEYHDSLMGVHLGIKKTTEKICRLFWWPAITIDIENHVKACPACQVSKHRNWKPQGRTPDLHPAVVLGL